MQCEMFIWFPLIPILLIAGMLATRYWVQRETTASNPPSPRDDGPEGDGAANKAEARVEMMRQQVIAKIHWGARDMEVYEWLEERHGITGSAADELLAEAHRAKRNAVRVKAFVMLAFSGCGILLSGGFIGVQIWAHFVWIGWVTAVAILVGVVSITTFLRNFWLLFTGRMEGSVD